MCTCVCACARVCVRVCAHVLARGGVGQCLPECLLSWPTHPSLLSIVHRRPGNPLPGAFVLAAAILYALLVAKSRRVDRREKKKTGHVFLQENGPGQQLYAVVVDTGFRTPACFTAKVTSRGPHRATHSQSCGAGAAGWLSRGAHFTDPGWGGFPLHLELTPTSQGAPGCSAEPMGRGQRWQGLKRPGGAGGAVGGCGVGGAAGWEGMGELWSGVLGGTGGAGELGVVHAGPTQHTSLL